MRTVANDTATKTTSTQERAPAARGTARATAARAAKAAEAAEGVLVGGRNRAA
jgi:hypothetical protein